MTFPMYMTAILSGDVAHHGQVVGDEEVGEGKPLLEVFEEVDDLRLYGDVEGGDGLVADEEGGVDREGPGNPYPLPLAARELVGVPGGCLRRESHDIEKLRHPARDAALPHDDKALADDIGDGHAGVERAEGVLEDHLYLSPVACKLLRPQTGDIVALRRGSWPAVGVRSLTTHLPTVVLPQPDSPTSPRVSPFPTEKLTPSTAFT